jgi:molybdopterin converting factor subunit 1
MQFISVEVRFFAAHRDIVGSDTLTLKVARGTTLGDVWKKLIDDYPRLAAYTGSIMCAINEQFSDPIVTLNNGDHIAFIPPVSGGR